ncbi:unnamed protein product [Notodromas monacha]|uniref:Activating signal cointegrator 1 complex subunit 3 n=1 Tax=Notodromas monacha TaxID=399045 RepID=A0A7R9BJ67_9CRUS|nr:unnamed protein product [Notodromas monacha]CAG0914939.1 unnamed protein product [Notodromas monacha]
MRGLEIPRLSSALRAATVQKRTGVIVTVSDDPAYENLLKKRKQRETERSRETFTWKDFISRARSVAGVNEAKLTQLAATVKDVAVFLSGGEEASSVDEAAIFLLKVFHKKTIASMSDIAELRKVFGDVDLQLARDACKAVGEIREILPLEFFDSFVSENASEGSSTEEFGLNCDVTIAEPLEQRFEIHFWDKKLVNVLNEGATAVDTRDDVPSLWQNGLVHSAPTSSKWNRHWLEAKLIEGGCGSAKDPVALNDLINSVISVVGSTKPSNEIQNELFDLLGFDFFELIQEMLEHRQELVDATKEKFEKAASEGECPSKERQAMRGVGISPVGNMYVPTVLRS